MARNPPIGSKAAEEKAAEEEKETESKILGPETAVAPMPGGSSGVIPDVSRDMLKEDSSFRPRIVEQVPVKQFRVVQGGHVMLDGVRVPMRVGKTVNHTTYDLDKLLAQGIRLEEIV